MIPLQQLRESAALSQEQVASALNIDTSLVSRYESADRPIPDDRLTVYVQVCLENAAHNWAVVESTVVEAAKRELSL